MRSNSDTRLIGTLESARELLRRLEQLRYIERCMPQLGEHVLETRLRLDREIEHLKQVG